jgi:hypothetical protein
VLDVRPATELLSLVVIADDIDLASSQQARAALRALITSVRAKTPDARVGLMVSEGAATPTLLNVTGGAAALDRTVTRLVQSGGAAPLLESIIVAADTLGKESTGRGAVLVITRQGWADRSVTPRRIADALLSQCVVTYAAGPTSGPGELRVGVRRDGVKVVAPGWAHRTASQRSGRR